MWQKTFKTGSGCLVVFGLIFLVAGLVFHISIVSQILSGKPVPVTVNGVRHENPGDLAQLGIALFPLIHATVGAVILLYTFRARVILTDEGVSVYGLRKKPSFDARWSEIQTYTIRPHRKGGESIVLETSMQSTAIHSQSGGYAGLKAELDKRLSSVRS